MKIDFLKKAANILSIGFVAGCISSSAEYYFRMQEKAQIDVKFQQINKKIEDNSRGIYYIKGRLFNLKLNKDGET